MAEGLVKAQKVYRDENGIPTLGVPERITVAELDTLTAPSGPTPAQASPLNTVLPTVSGDLTVGDVLTADDGTWTGEPAPVITRQWQKDGVNISGATGTTYTILVGDVGSDIRVVVTGTNTHGATSINSAEVGPILA